MTIGTLHTAHELDDLLRAKDSNLNDLTGAVASVHASVDFTSPSWAAWLGDYYAFSGRWAGIHLQADPAIADARASALGWDATTAESLWRAALGELPPLDDLERRWPALPGNPLRVYPTSPTPQPTAPDADLGFINATAPLFTPPKPASLWLAALGIGAGVVVALSILKRIP